VSAGSPRASRGASRTACSAAAALVLAGCGSKHVFVPHLRRADAASLAAAAGRIAVEPPCAQARDIQALHRRAIALVNAGRVPAALAEPFLSGFAALAAESPSCKAGAAAHPVPAGPPAKEATNVAPVPHAASAGGEARNLERWLESYSA
jgi:hypothetical protein